ncbi:formate dehydrogenase accessory sulfurtransferase FdhD [Jiella sp. MQZ9-1]|uniref:Sulfur carrier protein FdhD n=1 Tax=Jiella flava TaxID=2816857 RepID=A0A939G0C5_9HYPH|nr:formate dehydrogenase accessory sulfurtransferase FdhD [Jiella flava]MBO0663268.1 formate dehydrogenase accessory sulfurtransferase FdhD [Jiella flava]MCD2471844.1 formate dehydrogenase accessory sulfurtransferase FdhD [Jiella flava]
MSDARAQRVEGLVFRDGAFASASRAVPKEVAVAISVGGSTHAVLMATPADLEDMAMGLVLNEGIVDRAEEIEHLDIVETAAGIDCQVRLVAARAATYVARRRQMTGPVGCGLCGVESLELAAPQLPEVAAGNEGAFSPGTIATAIAAMGREQQLGRLTRAVHAAAWHDVSRGLVVSREDVGRHNALDKVAGHLARAGIDPAGGFLTITSRVSVELIQKAARMGCGLIAAVSAPTTLAISQAEAAGITLVAVARGADFEVFSHPERIARATQTAAPPADPETTRQGRAVYGA